MIISYLQRYKDYYIKDEYYLKFSENNGMMFYYDKIACNSRHYNVNVDISSFIYSYIFDSNLQNHVDMPDYVDIPDYVELPMYYWESKIK